VFGWGPWFVMVAPRGVFRPIVSVPTAPAPNFAPVDRCQLSILPGRRLPVLTVLRTDTLIRRTDVNSGPVRDRFGGQHNR